MLATDLLAEAVRFLHRGVSRWPGNGQELRVPGGGPDRSDGLNGLETINEQVSDVTQLRSTPACIR